MTLELRRGDVVRVRLDPTVGHEISKTRPAVVISNDLACRYDTVVQIVPVTGLRKKPIRRYEARLDSAQSGLDKPSRALANQVRTVAKERPVSCIGHLPFHEMQAVEKAPSIQLGFTKTA